MFQHRHILGIDALSPADIATILDLSDRYVGLNRSAVKHEDVLNGLTQINLFFENSTRTMASFELAGQPDPVSLARICRIISELTIEKGL